MPLKFRTQLIASEAFESVGVFDVDNDGALDIVSGGFWYKGPDFRKRFKTYDPPRCDEYYDDFSTIGLDVDGDGLTDFVTGGWWGETLRWIQNPGKPGAAWPVHEIAKTGNIETTRAWDIDGCGTPELVPNTPGAPLVVYKLAGGRFEACVISEQAQGHGLGCGDVAGNGRMDIVLSGGWFEAPARPWDQPWTWHPDFDLGAASVPILVADLNGDESGDLIVGQAHGYGLSWVEQTPSGWVTHAIDPENSQYHDMHWVDLDGDGQPELVTGKRFRAHCGNDPGEFDDIGVYYFKWNGETFSKQIVSYGAPGIGYGLGITSWVGDLRGSGRKDIVAAGKDGLKVFWNEGL